MNFLDPHIPLAVEDRVKMLEKKTRRIQMELEIISDVVEENAENREHHQKSSPGRKIKLDHKHREPLSMSNILNLADVIRDQRERDGSPCESPPSPSDVTVMINDESAFDVQVIGDDE